MERREFMEAFAGGALLAGGEFAHQTRRETPHLILTRFPPGCRAVSEHLWFENSDGQRAYPEWNRDPPEWPESHPYMVTRLAGELRGEMLQLQPDGSSKQIVAYGATWSEDLVLALVKRGYRLKDAIVMAATTCERCSNTLAYSLGLSWGYAVGSAEWSKSKTSCEWCKGDKC